MPSLIASDDSGRHIPSCGPCFLYVFPCVWEDYCKLGFSRDPLSRLQALHRRYFEFFDLDRVLLVETETVRDARDLELELGRPLVEFNAPSPLTIRQEAAGHTEWYRGASTQLEEAIRALQARGYVVHAPARAWLQSALRARAERLYAWSMAQLSPDEIAGLMGPTAMQQVVCDALDAYAALGIEVEPLVPVEVYRWYCGRRGTGPG